MIAIHSSKDSFSERWIDYCEKTNISFKIVNCYKSDIIEQLSECDALMWHHNHMNPRDVLFAKQLLYSVEQSGKIVFPNYKTNWHFDDKLGQKYLLESLNIPLVNSYVSYDKDEALNWSKTTTYPKVFKLRGGGGSWNVFLVKSPQRARDVIKKAFNIGFKQYDAWANIKERWYKYKLGKSSFSSLVMGFIRIFYEPFYSRVLGKDLGYVYFQDFIKGNDFDIRVIVTNKKAFAIKRMVRKNDFRASGSGNIRYEKSNFPEPTIQLAFDIAEKIQTQSVSIDFVYNNNIPKVVEISYGFVQKVYDPCVGYWDKDMNWHEGKFDPCEWMVDLVVDKIKEKESQKNSL
jgi:glutathione synthase/RimK-type ligase-like ATP-grasp enzyme